MTERHPSAPAPSSGEKVIIAHLGAHKTATSLVQRYFRDKRAYYAKPELDYETIQNSSISDRGLQLALRMNPLLEPTETNVVRRFLQEHFSNRTEPRPNLMAPDLKRELQNRYGDEYKALVAEG